MKTFKLKIDLLQGVPIEESGFDFGFWRAAPSRFTIWSKFAKGGYVFYIAGKCYSFRTENQLHQWMSRFSPESTATWAKEIDGDLVIIVLDTRMRTAYLISDRNGESRAYYCYQGDCVYISNSRIELIRYLKSPSISSFAAYQLLTLYYVVDPHSLIEQASTTVPGQIIRFEENNTVVSSYYSPVQDEADYFETEGECVRAFDAAFQRTIQKRLADERTPCVLLSGGIDSVMVLKYLTDAARGRVHTLTFTVKGLYRNELEPARIAAKYFQTAHHEITIDPADGAKLYIQSMIDADTSSNYSALAGVHMRAYLETLGGEFDAFTGDDNRLHTPPFDYPIQLGLLLNRGDLGSSPVVRSAWSTVAGLSELWPFEGRAKNYLRYWVNHLKPTADLKNYMLENLFGFHLPDENLPAASEHYAHLLAELPRFGRFERFQQVFKEYSSFKYRTQWTNDGNSSASSMAGPRTELQHPFFDWEVAGVANRIPYHLAMRPILTLKSWSPIPLVRKRIPRVLLNGSAPDELLYRAKATCPATHLFFNSPLRRFVDLMLEKWLADLLESVDSDVRRIITTYAKSYSARSIFVRNQDEKLLWAILAICYLAILNQICQEPSLRLADELEMLRDRSLREKRSERKEPSLGMAESLSRA
jgi:hypothetical protein